MIQGTERRLALPLQASIPLAAAAGAILDAGFPDRSWWILAPVGVTLMFVALLGRGPWAGLLVGMVAGSSFWMIHISWLTLYLGPVPWLALAGLESIFFGLSLAMIGIVLRVGPRVWPGVAGRLFVVPVVVAGLWTAREAISAVWPYGGFAWGRVALSQSESPFNGLVAWVGMSGLSFLLVWLSALVVQLLREVDVDAPVRAGIAVGAIAVLLVIPAFPVIQSGTTRLAAVQGASDAGLFAQYSPGQILADHTSATLPLIGQKVDFVVWPENGSDIDPLRSPVAARVLDYLSREMGVPIITGTITARGDRFYNSSLLWKNGEGAVDIYDKVHPVPFAEYMPDRAFWRPFAPELIDLISRDYAIGTRDNVFDINGIIAGIAICFDIADDQLVHEMIDDKAQIILAQTNNADFGHTDESVQQLAIARLRAIEAGRTVVNISTVGTSAIIGPDGRTIDRLPTWTPGAMVQEVPLSTVVTPAMAAGRGVEWLVAGLGLAGLALCILHAHPVNARRGVRPPVNALRTRRNRVRSR
ncbi:apolipoprotein N-acyltransferase [Cryobacterium sp. TMT1-21]|uniref:apolipoprotein N-acyltransferase n=1 Tax=unclassified Cryobacterium TaxID=2649013 RepID=UPI00106CF7BE|nr:MULTISPECIES: apolipoprotein N-acyltransferase [unclassified Cryobacterium]TFC81952.1 apolipoprotein N-acyltransferase [Cryobacterium sp. TmT2-59]TFD09557.1 apolipoprotein N-acyltransferase [Cryobacterium sp. TMT1-21]TFD18367.1 apolipoprotein N-acyltransferase [Cryobacterium sp. TMT2-23]TFD37301.1 apolipoprotein N-acyltransferase [Cryobacterium sp. TMT2-10]